MPTILRSGPYRLYFYSHEPNEAPHVHVDRDRSTCKIWLNDVALASSLGFQSAELRTIEKLVQDNRLMLLEAWGRFHG
jgi:hypothetical protein